MKTRKELAAIKASINANLSLPVGFAEVLEIVHVAACGWVLSIHSLSFLGISDLNEIPMIFNHKFSSIKMFSSNYSSPFAINVINLWSWKESIFSFPSWFTSLQICWLLGIDLSLKKMLQKGICVYCRQSCRSTMHGTVEEMQDESGTHSELLGSWTQSLPIKKLRSAVL